MNNLDELKERKNALKKAKVFNRTLLDIGAGPLSVVAAKYFKCSVTSIDISEEKLREWIREAKKEKQKIAFAVADATSLPYKNNSFDIVFSYAALHHIDLNERKKFLNEVFRVGIEKIVIVEYNKEGFENAHSEDDYKPVNLDWLENELKNLGKTEKYLGKEMNIYVCFKK